MEIVVTVAETRAHAERFLGELHQQVHDELEHVTLYVVSAPPPGAPSDTKGVFIGRPRLGPDDEEDDDEDHAPAEGLIFLVAPNLTSGEDVERAACHEIGHALGLDEWEAIELGLE